MNKETGGPAFPQPLVRQLMQAGEIGGMTLRDYFAAKAMQGMVSDGAIAANCGQGRVNGLALMSYEIADAMLKERAP